MSTESDSLWDLLLWLLFSAISWFALSVILNVSNNNNDLIATPTFLLFWGYIWAFIWISVKIIRSENLKNILKRIPNRREWKEIIVIAFQLFIFSICLFIILHELFSIIAPSLLRLLVPNNSELLVFNTNLSDYSALFKNIQISMIGLIFAPFIEEFVFRGILFQNLKKKWNTKLALIVTSVMFALLHTDFFGKFLFGMVMGILYLKTGKLLITIICHALSNAISFSLISLNFVTSSSELMKRVNEYIWVSVLLFILVSVALGYFLYRNWSVVHIDNFEANKYNR